MLPRFPVRIRRLDQSPTLHHWGPGPVFGALVLACLLLAACAAPSASLPDPLATPTPTPTPDFSSWQVETRGVPSPGGAWLAETTVALPLADGNPVSDQYYQALRILSSDGSLVREVVDRWSPWGLGYTIPVPLQWSPDGRYLYYTNRPVPDGCAPFANGSDVIRVEREQGVETEIAPAVGLVLALSPEAGTLAYINRDGGLVLRDLNSGAERVAPIQEVAQGASGAIVWSPDGSALMLTVAANSCGPPEERTHAILRVEVDSLETVVAVEPDDRLLVTAAWPEAERVLLVDGQGQRWQLNPSTGEVTPAEDNG